MTNTLMIKYLSVITAAALKFFAGPITGMALGLSWFESALCSAVGMMLSVLVTTYVGKGIQVVLNQRRQTPVRKFNKSSRLAVKIWKRFGIIGIAILTPLLFTPIGGTLIAVAFRVPRQAIFFWMLVSGLSLGAALSYLVYKLSFIPEWFAR
jgi:uncharacterized membrane protein